eukprot:1845723-Prymnesium_polylepis.2
MSPVPSCNLLWHGMGWIGRQRRWAGRKRRVVGLQAHVCRSWSQERSGPREMLRRKPLTAEGDGLDENAPGRDRRKSIATADAGSGKLEGARGHGG